MIEGYNNSASKEGCVPANVANAEINRKLDILLRTGCLLIESHADTSRTLRNMKRVAAFLGIHEKNLHISINYDVIIVNLSDEFHSFTEIRCCQGHSVNLWAIMKVSKLTWNCIKDDYTLECYEDELEKIRTHKRNYTPWEVAAGGGFACGGFCIQFGCDWTAFFYASIAAILGFRLKMWMAEKGMNAYVGIAIAAFVSTLIAWGFVLFSMNTSVPLLHSSTPYHPFMACALYLVPGVPLINFVSDMLASHFRPGIVRAVNTLMIVLAMAFGIAFAIEVCGVDNFVKTLSMTPHHEYWEYSLAAAISAMGFSMIFNCPPRLLWTVAMGGIIAICTRNLVSLGPSTHNFGLDMGSVIGTFAGSAVISIICTKLIHVVHAPHQCISIPSVIPMVPGVLMYRALFAFIDMHGVVGEVTVAMTNLINASLIILCISLGVAIPNIFFRKLIAPRRERKMIDLVVQRRLRHSNTFSDEGM